MRWSVGDAAWPHSTGLAEDLEERVARHLEQYQESSMATWTRALLAGTFVAMVLFAILH